MGSVAIGDESGLLAEKAFTGPLRHSSEIFPSLQEILAQVGATPDDVTEVYLSAGPGSFTGLRIAVTIAKTMHLATSVRIVAVDTLDAIAANATALQDAPERIAAILDAKRYLFFVAVYERPSRRSTDSAAKAGPALDAPLADWVKVVPDSIMAAEQLLQQFAGQGQTLGVLGDGLLFHQDRFKADGVRLLDQSSWSPRASTIYRLGRPKAQCGQFEDPLRLTPFYLTPPEVTLKVQR